MTPEQKEYNILIFQGACTIENGLIGSGQILSKSNKDILKFNEYAWWAILEAKEIAKLAGIEEPTT